MTPFPRAGLEGYHVLSFVSMQAHHRQNNEVMAAMFSLEIAHRLKVRTKQSFLLSL